MGLESNGRYPDDSVRSGTFDPAFTITPQELTQIVSEPSTPALAAGGLVALATMTRRRTRT